MLLCSFWLRHPPSLPPWRTPCSDLRKTSHISFRILSEGKHSGISDFQTIKLNYFQNPHRMCTYHKMCNPTCGPQNVWCNMKVALSNCVYYNFKQNHVRVNYFEVARTTWWLQFQTGLCANFCQKHTYIHWTLSGCTCLGRKHLSYVIALSSPTTLSYIYTLRIAYLTVAFQNTILKVRLICFSDHSFGSHFNVCHYKD